MVRNRGQEAVLNRKTVKFVETVSLSLTTIRTKSAASPLALLLKSYLEARKQGQEAVLIRKTVIILETVSLQGCHWCRYVDTFVDILIKAEISR